MIDERWRSRLQVKSFDRSLCWFFEDTFQMWRLGEKGGGGDRIGSKLGEWRSPQNLALENHWR